MLWAEAVRVPVLMCVGALCACICVPSGGGDPENETRQCDRDLLRTAHSPTVAGGAGPSLKYSGSAVTAGMWPSWSPIGAEQMSGGDDVAWKNSSTGMFSFWSTDSNSNFATPLV